MQLNARTSYVQLYQQPCIVLHSPGSKMLAVLSYQTGIIVFSALLLCLIRIFMFSPGFLPCLNFRAHYKAIITAV